MRWNVITSPCWTVRVGPGSVILVAAHPHPAGAEKLAYSGMLTALAGVSPIGAPRTAIGDETANAAIASPMATNTSVFENRYMVPSSAARACPHT